MLKQNLFYLSVFPLILSLSLSLEFSISDNSWLWVTGTVKSEIADKGRIVYVSIFFFFNCRTLCRYESISQGTTLRNPCQDMSLTKYNLVCVFPEGFPLYSNPGRPSEVTPRFSHLILRVQQETSAFTSSMITTIPETIGHEWGEKEAMVLHQNHGNRTLMTPCLSWVFYMIWFLSGRLLESHTKGQLPRMCGQLLTQSQDLKDDESDDESPTSSQKQQGKEQQ